MGFLRLARTCEETCESVWPPNASLYASSTGGYLGLLASPSGQGLRTLLMLTELMTFYTFLRKHKPSKLVKPILSLYRDITHCGTTVHSLRFTLKWYQFFTYLKGPRHDGLTLRNTITKITLRSLVPYLWVYILRPVDNKLNPAITWHHRMPWRSNNRDLKHRFWTTDGNRTFMFLVLVRRFQPSLRPHHL